MDIDTLIAFYMQLFGLGLFTGLGLGFFGWCIKKIINVYHILTSTTIIGGE